MKKLTIINTFLFILFLAASASSFCPFAEATVRGRLTRETMTKGFTGVSKARITVIETAPNQGRSFPAMTNPFGYFHLNLPTCASYEITVGDKRYQFDPVIFSLSATVEDYVIDLVAVQ